MTLLIVLAAIKDMLFRIMSAKQIAMFNFIKTVKTYVLPAIKTVLLVGVLIITVATHVIKLFPFKILIFAFSSATLDFSKTTVIFASLAPLNVQIV